MRLLLDTQAFVYIARQPEALPVAARTAIEDSSNAIFLSIASPFELQIKINIGKITFSKPLRDAIEFELARATFKLFPITLSHIAELSRLPAHHKDPFDRIIIAQARIEGLTIVTGDQVIARYPVPTLWD